MSSLAPIKPETIPDQFGTLNQVLQRSYTQAKKQIQDGAHAIQESITTFKEELIDIYDKAGEYISKNVVLPVNNFLKDRSQIESELQLEMTKEFLGAGFTNSSHNGAFYLEENY